MTNRIIKFRLRFGHKLIGYEKWEECQWWYSKDLLHWSPGEFGSAISDKDQFCGLHDKNDKEIYEGDVVRPFDYMAGGHGEVWWQPARSAFVIDWSHAKNVGKHDYQLVNHLELEVIGNIYENPELIK